MSMPASGIYPPAPEASSPGPDQGLQAPGASTTSPDRRTKCAQSDVRRPSHTTANSDQRQTELRRTGFKTRSAGEPRRLKFRLPHASPNQATAPTPARTLSLAQPSTLNHRPLSPPPSPASFPEPNFPKPPRSPGWHWHSPRAVSYSSLPKERLGKHLPWVARPWAACRSG
jgi:hypothetical protein